MTQYARLKSIISAILFVGAVFATGNTAAQQMLKDQILGNWILTTVSDIHSDGRKENPWGPTVKGSASFDNKGRFTWIIIGADLAPSGRSQVSSRMTLAYFGAYTVDEASMTVTYTLEGSTAPQFDGVVRKGVVSIAGNEMKHVSAPIPVPGGTVAPNLTFKRPM